MFSTLNLRSRNLPHGANADFTQSSAIVSDARSICGHWSPHPDLVVTVTAPPVAKASQTETARSNGTYATVYFINGIMTDPLTFRSDLTVLVNVFGGEVTGILNPAAAKLGLDIRNAVRAFLCPETAVALEMKTCAVLEKVLDFHVKKNRPLHVVAFSEGSIVVYATLHRWLSAPRTTPVQIRSLQSLLRVTTFGAANHRFFSDFKISSYSQRNDPVVGVSRIAELLRPSINLFQDKSRKRRVTTTVPHVQRTKPIRGPGYDWGRTHDVSTYAADWHKFVGRSFPDGRGAITQLCRDYMCASLADHVINKSLDYVVGRSDVRQKTTLLEQVDDLRGSQMLPS